MKIKGRKISDYCGKHYEFTMPDGTRKSVFVSRKEGMKEAREKLEKEMK